MKKRKIIVIKIGSSILITQRGNLDEFRIAHIASQIAHLRRRGFGIILVVSGAVACGSKFIRFSKEQYNLQQAAAGIGQAILTSTLRETFTERKIQIAQLLLTKENILVNRQKEKIKSLLFFYTSLGFITIINENDALDLNSFGGNDYLAAEITTLIKADRLIILSSHDKSLYGIGGMKSKLKVKNLMKLRNIKTNILDGKSKDTILEEIL